MVHELKEKENMNKMKKRIVALSTAFVMALALVAAVVPAATVEAANVNSVKVNAGNLRDILIPVGKELTKDVLFQNAKIKDPETGVVNSKYSCKLVKRVPSSAEFSAWVNGTGADTWSYSSSDFPMTIKADTDYIMLYEAKADEGNNYKVDVPLTITGAESYGRLGVYSVNATNDTFYFWADVKNSSSPEPDPQPVDPGNTDVTPSSSTDANTASTSSTPTTTKATTTSKATASNAKTADPVPYAAVAVLVAGVAAVSVVAIRRRRS